MKCSKDQILRKGYTTKSGVKVKPKCVDKKTYLTKKDVSSGKFKDWQKEQTKKKKESQKKAAKLTGDLLLYHSDVVNKCPPGTKKRSAFIAERKGTKYTVPATCVPGEKSKSKVRIGPMQKGLLSDYGYRDLKHSSVEDRHKALERASKDIPPMTVFRTVNALSVLHKNKPQLHKILESDKHWVRSNLT
ncbi:MAG: hypothetical protein QW303_01115 [Nitrososphaerota archaeon]